MTRPLACPINNSTTNHELISQSRSRFLPHFKHPSPKTPATISKSSQLQSPLPKKSNFDNNLKQKGHKYKIKVFRQNIQHPKSRTDALEIVLEELKPDNILILSEHDI